jgi:hypothetical protein
MATGFQKHLFCRECGRHTLHVRANTEMSCATALAMSFLTIITCCLALPFVLAWAIIIGLQAGSQQYHCQVCGQAYGSTLR